MTIGKGKRPTDPNQLAKWVVDQATSEAAPIASISVSEYMASIGRKGGQIGGKRRLTTMTKQERSKIATRAAKARWSKRKKT